jgi:hypothetical protein
VKKNVINVEMGLIAKPKEVDFYVIDKPWNEDEKREFSELIKKQKAKLRKGPHRLHEKS